MKRFGLFAGVAIVVLALTSCAGSSVDVGGGVTVESAESAASEYLGLISDGHVKDATAMTAASALPAASVANLALIQTDDALAEAVRITDVVVGADVGIGKTTVNKGSSSASVPYAYNLDGEPNSGTVELKKDDGAWVVTAGVVTLSSADPEEDLDFQASIGGVAINTKESFAMYPAVYKIAFGDDPSKTVEYRAGDGPFVVSNGAYTSY